MSTSQIVDRYTYRVSWADEDDEYVATCVEFPSLSWLDESRGSALDGIVTLVADVVKDMAKKQEEIPEPLTERRFSGKFLVRASPSMHGRLVREAAEQHISLNQWALQKLSSTR
jgi:predicted HicB family RNase H-like nuclease